MTSPGGRGWAGEKLVLHKLRFHPDFVAPFSPPCEGGVITPAAKKVIYQPEARARDPVRFPRWRVGLICSSMRNFLAGVIGGVVPARPVTRSSHALSFSVLSHPSREARRIVLDFQGSRITPPTPPSQGEERDRSLATSFHRAQQTCEPGSCPLGREVRITDPAL